jgi:hypothetical protein
MRKSGECGVQTGSVDESWMRLMMDEEGGFD